MSELLDELKYQLELRKIEVPTTENAIDELMRQRSISPPEPYTVLNSEGVNPLARLFGMDTLLGRVAAKLEILFAKELATPSVYDGDVVTDEMLANLMAKFPPKNPK